MSVCWPELLLGCALPRSGPQGRDSTENLARHWSFASYVPAMPMALDNGPEHLGRRGHTASVLTLYWLTGALYRPGPAMLGSPSGRPEIRVDREPQRRRTKRTSTMANSHLRYCGAATRVWSTAPSQCGLAQHVGAVIASRRSYTLLATRVQFGLPPPPGPALCGKDHTTQQPQRYKGSDHPYKHCINTTFRAHLNNMRYRGPEQRRRSAV
jgi:hypothetical protein